MLTDEKRYTLIWRMLWIGYLFPHPKCSTQTENIHFMARKKMNRETSIHTDPDPDFYIDLYYFSLFLDVFTWLVNAPVVNPYSYPIFEQSKPFLSPTFFHDKNGGRWGSRGEDYFISRPIRHFQMNLPVSEGKLPPVEKSSTCPHPILIRRRWRGEKTLTESVIGWVESYKLTDLAWLEGPSSCARSGSRGY